MKGIWKSFDIGGRSYPVLKGINLNFYSGEFAIIFGPSGCGKSTLLHVMLGLEEPDRGRVYLRGKSIYNMDDDNRTQWRRKKVGMVFQQSNWIRSLNVWENVAYPLFLTRMKKKMAEEKAKELLKTVGLEKAFYQHPTELSGGEQQKAALARALATNPGIIVCDEPTGNLDSKSSRELINLLKYLHQKKRKIIIMVTHERNFLSVGNRLLAMKDGKIISDRHD